MQVIAQVVHRTSRYTLLGANVLLEGVIGAVLLAAVAEYSLGVVCSFISGFLNFWLEGQAS
jgi:hypothetical protein